MPSTKTIRSHLLLGTALMVVCGSMPARAQVQEAEDTSDAGLSEIVVTAQKREQSLQDVPVAVTAIGADALVANRITSVEDLSGLAPGVTVRPAAGGSKLPNFTIRGALSIGVVPGSDKQVSIYLDGVYISSPRGSIFALPDTQRIEVLRGPQGTLFGRNATAGAVSVVTADPSGKAHVIAGYSYGNYDSQRYRITAETPQMGPFSARFSYVRESRRGDFRNLGAGQLWDRTVSYTGRARKVERSPDTLGSTDSNSYFASLKFEHGDFTAVYKFDHNEDVGSPPGTALLGYNKNFPLVGSLVDALITSNGVVVQGQSRPKALPNSYVNSFDQSGSGHSLTMTFQASDQLSFKNIAAYRQSYIASAASLDGVSALTFTPQAIAPYATLIAFSTGQLRGNESLAVQGAVIGAIAKDLGDRGLVGQPFVLIPNSAQGRSKQWSNELQAVYQSDLLAATVGGIYFHSKDYSGEPGFNNPNFLPVVGGAFDHGTTGIGFNRATSIAGYAQLEFHATSQLDLVAGGRITNDKKLSNFRYTTNGGATFKAFSAPYNNTQFTYLLGVNYKPTEDILAYAKYSTAFVSGGNTAGLEFAVEKAKSFEAGLKAELLDRRLRANLSVYHVKYNNVQLPTAANLFAPQITQITGDPILPNVLSTVVYTLGDQTTKGVEFEVDAAPVRNLNLGGSIAYTDSSLKNVNPLATPPGFGPYDADVIRPHWQASLNGQYQTPPVFGDAFVTARIDALWRSGEGIAQNPGRPIYAIAPQARSSPAYWLVNGRVSLRDINLGGVKAELAVWGKNLFDVSRIISVTNLNDILVGGGYIPARTYGLDFNIEF